MSENANIEQSEIINQFPGLYFWTEDADTQAILYSENIIDLTGYSVSELKNLEHGLRSLIYDADLPHYRKFLDEVEKSSHKEILELEYRLIKKDESIGYVFEKIQVLRNDDGSILKRSGMILNVTNYKVELEYFKTRAEQLEVINSAKDNFISILSHDLRAPFTSILGFSEIILNETSLPEKDKAEYVKFIYDSSNNQLQLVNHLFDWSQIQTGRVKFEIQRLHAQSIVYNCVSYLTGLAMRKNININVKIPDSFHIDADERFVSKVFMNLVSNAIKYSFENGTVEVNGNVYNDDFVEFVVKDKGVGISETNRERIFNIARLFSTEGTKGEKGSGLGLTLSKQIVEKHRGNFWFYSQEGKGSEFHFTLPAATSYLLLVIDDKDKLEELEKDLNKNFPNFEVLKTENAFEAMETIAEKSPSLIIIEHMLPIMDGLQLVNAVRERHKQIKIPFIVFVDSDSDDLIKSYQEINVKILKQKPSVNESLKDKIDMLLYS
jgi:signal transduction histidine kinase/CheY-like chemotaxis protein